jgi:AcrR family transcriptional regulator
MTSRLPTQISLREQNKLEKNERIRRAARELISKYGFDQATLRQIANRADVRLGTLCHYAQDKRDLAILICNPYLAEVLDLALKAQRPNEPLIDRAVESYGPRYESFGKDPAISRNVLKELVFYSEGKQAETFLRTRWRIIPAIETMARREQKTGIVKSTQDALRITHLIFLAASGSIRWWIAWPFPEPNAGLAELRRLPELPFRCFGPRSQMQPNQD